MKVYTLNTRPDEQMTLDDAIDWLQENLFFKLDEVNSVEETTIQSEFIDVLLDAYFIIEEIDDDDSWEDDTEEREKEFRREQL